MGKGDKKTKRGKIVIGSSGVRRARKKRNTTPAVASKVEPDKNTEVVEMELAAEKAAKKSSKKAEVTASVEDKSKAPKAKKKPAADELLHEEPKQE